MNKRRKNPAANKPAEQARPYPNAITHLGEARKGDFLAAFKNLNDQPAVKRLMKRLAGL